MTRFITGPISAEDSDTPQPRRMVTVTWLGHVTVLWSRLMLKRSLPNRPLGTDGGWVRHLESMSWSWSRLLELAAAVGRVAIDLRLVADIVTVGVAVVGLEKVVNEGLGNGAVADVAR
jgi:hypothetical protein